VNVPRQAVARWYRDQIAVDTRSGARLHPRFFTAADAPLVADVEQAAARPAPVLLAATCHLDDVEIDSGGTNAKTDLVIAGNAYGTGVANGPGCRLERRVACNERRGNQKRGRFDSDPVADVYVQEPFVRCHL
jgi:hypothetical protein